MFTILLASIYTAKNRVMAVPKKTVSQVQLEEEWQEIQAAQSNPAAFQTLYRRYYEPIFRFVYRRTDDEHLTADLCSQVFLKAMQRLTSYEYRGVPFSAWLYRIASNEVTQHFRNSQQRRTVSAEDHQLGELAEELVESSPEIGQEALVGALDSLSESDIQLIEMRFFEQRPFKEIADILELTESNAKVRTYRILQRLRKKLTVEMGNQH